MDANPSTQPRLGRGMASCSPLEEVVFQPLTSGFKIVLAT
jgi:hypothetical protein